MSLFRTIAAAALVGSLALNAFLAWRAFPSGQHVEVQLSAPDRIEVIRTPGGLLQVSTIKSPETFQATTDHRFLGIDLGQTTTQIRVPAVFNYHVELAPEWKVTVHGNAAPGWRGTRNGHWAWTSPNLISATMLWLPS